MSQPVRRKPGNDYGIIAPLLGIAFAVALLGFWPAMVWHGYGGPAGTAWRWDIHSTIAETVYFGAIGFIAWMAWMAWLGNRPAKLAPPKGRLRVEATTPEQLRPPPASVCVPPCYHLDAVPVDLSTGDRVAWLCPLPPEGCGEGLPAGHGRLMRPCCGSAPGFPHLYNCPHLTGGPR